MRKVLLAGMLTCMGCSLMAQPANSEKANKGKIILTTFGNLHTGFGSSNDDRGFELERAYLGYQYNFANGLEIKTVADFGQSKDVKDMNRIGYLKNAYVSWKRNGWKLSGGLISTTQFKTQESFWGKRYVMKSFQDEYKLGSSADLGLSVAYTFNDKVSADVIIVNGEGYKKVQFKDGLQYGAGLTLKPCQGLTIRAYGSYNEATVKGEKGITNLAGFAGYQHDKFSIGAEYNFQMNSGNVKAHHQNGTSVYAHVPACSKVNIFGRWDYLDSNHSWNRSKDGMAGVAGVEVKLCKQVKLAPTFRLWAPDAPDSKNEYAAYVHASFAL